MQTRMCNYTIVHQVAEVLVVVPLTHRQIGVVLAFSQLG